MRPRLFAAVMSASALVAFAGPALAIDPQAAAQALATALGGGTSAKVTFDGASEAGGNVVIQGLSVTDSRGEGTVRFNETIIEAPTEGGAGIYDSPRIAFTGGTISGDGKGTIASASLTDVTILDPAKVAGDAPAKGVLFRTAEALDIRVAPVDKPGEVTIARGSMEVGNVVDNIPRDSKGAVEDIVIPPELFGEGSVGPQTIGYDRLVLDVSWDASRDPAAKTMTVRDFTLAVEDGGRLAITGVAGDLPEPTALNDADAPSKAHEIKLHAITVRYEENSLAGRILDHVAQQQGLSRADYANQMAAALPFLLAMVNNPEFQTEVANAVGAFLKDPKSLTLKIEPAAPISGEEIINILGSAPQTLPDRLNVSLTAND